MGRDVNEPLSVEQYEPIRQALFERKNRSATEARQALADSLDEAGFGIVSLDDRESEVRTDLSDCDHCYDSTESVWWAERSVWRQQWFRKPWKETTAPLGMLNGEGWPYHFCPTCGEPLAPSSHNPHEGLIYDTHIREGLCRCGKRH